MAKMTLKVKAYDPHFSIPGQSTPGCMFDANLVILTQICDELSRGQTEFPRILTQNGQNDIEGQGQWPLFSIPTKSIPWCMLGANLVILAQIYDELWCGQVKVYRRTDGRTDAGNETKKPIRPERPRGKNFIYCRTDMCKTGVIWERTVQISIMLYNKMHWVQIHVSVSLFVVTAMHPVAAASVTSVAPQQNHVAGFWKYLVGIELEVCEWVCLTASLGHRDPCDP